MRAKFQGEIRNLSADLDHMREQFEEEQESKSILQRQLGKAQSENQDWKRKFETGGFGDGGEAEEIKYVLLHACVNYDIYSE